MVNMTERDKNSAIEALAEWQKIPVGKKTTEILKEWKELDKNKKRVSII